MPIGIVVPCFNEAARLDVESFEACARGAPDLSFCFVDDGSCDPTFDILRQLEARVPRVSAVRLPANVGKAEAVRQGIRHLLATGAYDLVGYLDADLATPLDQLPLLIDAFGAHPDAVMAFGSRVRLLGREIERWEVRHYVGRVFATAASMILGLAVYDTQCGAKLIRAPVAQTVFEAPFIGRWVFDVELFARLVVLLGHDEATRRLIEVPLLRWRDQGDSRIGSRDLLKVPIDLLRVAARYRR